MIIDGRKVACATCIKGHRASHCQHKDRQLIEIKKKGRPATQCTRCRELRLVRQLHVKCDCNDIPPQPPARITKKTKKNNNHANLRAIAPKPELACGCVNATSNNNINGATPPPLDHKDLLLSVQQQQQQQQQQQLLPSLWPIQSQKRQGEEREGYSSSCCSSSNSSSAPSPELVPSSHPSRTTPSVLCKSNESLTPTKSSSGCGCSNSKQARQPMAASKEGCCGGSKDNSQDAKSKPKHGDRVRVITCRCGDSCACPGCDAHPSRAMKVTSDPYMMMVANDSDHPRKQLSIAAICTSSAKETMNETPSAILDEIELCNCGSVQLLQGCTSCNVDDFCQGYLR